MDSCNLIESLCGEDAHIDLVRFLWVGGGEDRQWVKYRANEREGKDCSNEWHSPQEHQHRWEEVSECINERDGSVEQEGVRKAPVAHMYG